MTDFFSVVFSGCRNSSKMMYHLTNAETGEVVSPMGEKDLQFLSKHLEGEFIEDEEYIFTTAELEQLEVYDMGDRLYEALRKALDEADSVPLIWSRA